LLPLSPSSLHDLLPVAGISVDWLSGNVYWTDATLGHVMVSRLDGRYHRILVSSAGQPRGVSADPTNRSVGVLRSFWCHNFVTEGVFFARVMYLNHSLMLCTVGLSDQRSGQSVYVNTA